MPTNHFLLLNKLKNAQLCSISPQASPTLTWTWAAGGETPGWLTGAASWPMWAPCTWSFPTSLTSPGISRTGRRLSLCHFIILLFCHFVFCIFFLSSSPITSLTSPGISRTGRRLPFCHFVIPLFCHFVSFSFQVLLPLWCHQKYHVQEEGCHFVISSYCHSVIFRHFVNCFFSFTEIELIRGECQRSDTERWRDVLDTNRWRIRH